MSARVAALVVVDKTFHQMCQVCNAFIAVRDIALFFDDALCDRCLDSEMTKLDMACAGI